MRKRREIAAGSRLAVALAPEDLAHERRAHEALLLLLGAVLEEGRSKHARSLADHLPRRLRALELLANDRLFERIERLLAAAVGARHVAVEVAGFDRLLTKLGLARGRLTDPPDHLLLARVGAVFVGPGLGEEGA